ncbi:NEDD8-activating enzyme E1 regulatory subunit [Boothiomyces sp. JEL0866]|nr:NEDD8-activating enzyme E1 regulatory subunit [Boothiomyces sp. JEL0866]
MATTSETPNSKEQKYDRQLRYFVISTQELVHIVTGEGAGSNFFLDQGSIGRSKAECVSKLLNELNPDDASKMIKTEPEIFKQFTIIIVSELPESDLLSLSELAWNANIPLVLVRTISRAYRHININPVIEIHPDSNIDLRLDCPWRELMEYADNYQMNANDSMTLTHTPYPNAKLPSSKDERSEFHRIIKDLLPQIPEDEENIKEAFSNCSRLFRGTKIPDEINGYLSDSAVCNVNEQSSDFWIMLKALQLFVENEGKGQLPLPGSVPDMKADTESYVLLQKLYHEKADSDKQCFKNYLVTLCKNLKRKMIDADLVDVFCKNAGFLKVIRTNSLKRHLNSSPDNNFSISAITLENAAKNGENELYYLVLRTADRFMTLHGRYPGTVDESFESDLVAFEALFDTFLKEVGILDANYHSKVKEIVYAGARELPSIAALLGGIASQEVIKLITNQYLPVDNCYVFDGVTSTSTSFKM